MAYPRDTTVNLTLAASIVLFVPRPKEYVPATAGTPPDCSMSISATIPFALSTSFVVATPSSVTLLVTEVADDMRTAVMSPWAAHPADAHRHKSRARNIRFMTDPLFIANHHLCHDARYRADGQKDHVTVGQ